VQVVDVDWVADQAVILEDMAVAAFKVGALGSIENISVIAEIVSDYPGRSPDPGPLHQRPGQPGRRGRPPDRHPRTAHSASHRDGGLGRRTDPPGRDLA
jgi:hypothetical protein